jgi:hypothetical protein
MFVNEVVCHFGIATGYGCGTISTTSFAPGTVEGHTYSNHYVLVGDDTANFGDSGGPEFSGNSAFGTIVGGFFGAPWFMAQNYMSDLNIKVKTG